MPNKEREKLMKAASENSMRKRSNFFQKLFNGDGKTRPAKGVRTPLSTQPK